MTDLVLAGSDGVTVLDMIAQLTRPHPHREHYVYEGAAGTSYGLNHTVRAPALLTQLEHLEPSSVGDTATPGGFKSQPAARLESLDTLVRIDLEASRWVTDMGESDTGTTADVVRRLGGLLPSTVHCGSSKAQRDEHRKIICCTRHMVEADIRSWWTQARVIAGWDTAPWRPDATCPNCAKRGGLRVRLSAHSGVCIECGETWTPESIDELAFHIRVESFETRSRRPAACWCPWPSPVEVVDQLCPKCASGRCHRAISANLTKKPRPAKAERIGA